MWKDTVKLYDCDQNKNKECKKTYCAKLHLGLGVHGCTCTRKIECSTDGVLIVNGYPQSNKNGD